ncbi:MAG: L-seryl-tRNA(Sec) selenium transferase [Myxococcaceae bacterium]|nr:MAG: L-seryl-tRNA(Sec) selenium transferase [Myxococcaceae bacterium]
MSDGGLPAGTRERLRALPSVEAVLVSEAGRAALQIHPRPRVVEAIRRVLAVLRGRILQGEAASFSSDALGPALVALATPGLRPVLNATGVVLHTNLGRAPLAPEALARVEAVGRGYSNLEVDLESGERGSRFAPLLEPLRALTGAEDAMVVNNCAAATLLVLTALAEGREVVVSRGELVEIGGGFRVPDVMRQSHATLVEVGTTNRTRRADYERALSPATALVAKVHRSNFALVGFTEETTVEELARLCQPRGVPLFVDAGSGLLAPLDLPGAPAEPTMRGHVEAGADLVAFSGDKLLGGPQAGIVVGRAFWVSRLRAHPLARALRVDKLTVAALEVTLRMVQEGRGDEIPARALALASEPVLRARADVLRQRLADGGVEVRVVHVEGQVGGGTLPLARPRSWACVVDGDAEALATRLRTGEPSVLGRIEEGRLVLDVRCIDDPDVARLAEAVVAARASLPGA